MSETGRISEELATAKATNSMTWTRVQFVCTTYLADDSFKGKATYKFVNKTHRSHEDTCERLFSGLAFQDIRQTNPW